MGDRRLGLLLRARAGREVEAVLVVLGVVEQRYEAVMAVVRDGHTVVDVAERFGVARQSVHRWIRRYEAGGLAGLADRSHRPVSCPHQMPLEVEERVVAVRCAHPGWGPLRIVDRLGRCLSFFLAQHPLASSLTIGRESPLPRVPTLFRPAVREECRVIIGLIVRDRFECVAR